MESFADKNTLKNINWINLNYIKDILQGINTFLFPRPYSKEINCDTLIDWLFTEQFSYWPSILCGPAQSKSVLFDPLLSIHTIHTYFLDHLDR